MYTYIMHPFIYLICTRNRKFKVQQHQFVLTHPFMYLKHTQLPDWILRKCRAQRYVSSFTHSTHHASIYVPNTRTTPRLDSRSS